MKRVGLDRSLDLDLDLIALLPQSIDLRGEPRDDDEAALVPITTTVCSLRRLNDLTGRDGDRAGARA